MSKLDKSLLTAEQKKLYDGIEEELKEHAEHIAKNGDKIEHQRSHFSMLSEMKEVKNPYFGSKMITCGTVEDVIK